jgi:hypothetical protein
LWRDLFSNTRGGEQVNMERLDALELDKDTRFFLCWGFLKLGS